jgi:hypothetical protein
MNRAWLCVISSLARSELLGQPPSRPTSVFNLTTITINHLINSLVLDRVYLIRFAQPGFRCTEHCSLRSASAMSRVPTRAHFAESLMLLRHALWEQEHGAINYRSATRLDFLLKQYSCWRI